MTPGTKVVVLPELMELEVQFRSYNGFKLLPGMRGVVNDVLPSYPGMICVIFKERTCLVRTHHLAAAADGICGQCDGVPAPDDYLCEACRQCL